MASFDADAIVRLGWRQGAVLGDSLSAESRKHAPHGIAVAERDWLIVTSHDCDIVNPSLEKEPSVEILRGVVTELKAPDKQRAWGRNPRMLQLPVEQGSDGVVLACRAHERWAIPRELLTAEAPRAFLSGKHRRLVSQWLAKRYIRAAFPTAFDRRWHPKLKEWLSILEDHSKWIQGVYLRLNTLEELDGEREYRCHLIVAVPEEKKGEPGWVHTRNLLERAVGAFWNQFAPGIVFDEVEVLGTDEVTLADIENHQRFDADWVSFADDTPATPPATGMTA